MGIKYAEINTKALNQLLSVKKHVSSIDDGLKALVEIRVSQINRCAYCLDLHSKEAREAGISQQKLDCLAAYKESGLFCDGEKAALRWAESVTNISTQTDMEGELKDLLNHFDEGQVVDITLIISLMNCLNRMAISMGDRPGVRMDQ